MPPAIAGTLRKVLSKLLMTTRAFGKRAFAPRANLGLGLHCHHKHDVVEHLGLNFAPPQAEPFANLKLLDMTAALVKAHLAEIVVLRLDFDRHCAFAVGVCDVLVRQLLKVCIFENFVQGSDQIVIGAIALYPVDRGVACDLRTEIVIIIAQPIERLGIFVVTDRAQRTGKTPKKFAFCGVC